MVPGEGLGGIVGIHIGFGVVADKDVTGAVGHKNDVPTLGGHPLPRVRSKDKGAHDGWNGKALHVVIGNTIGVGGPFDSFLAGAAGIVPTGSSSFIVDQPVFGGERWVDKEFVGASIAANIIPSIAGLQLNGVPLIILDVVLTPPQ